MKRQNRRVLAVSRFLGLLTVTLILSVFGYFIYLIFSNAISQPDVVSLSWPNQDTVRETATLGVYLLISLLVAVGAQLLTSHYLSLRGSLSGILVIGLRFLAGLPVLMVLVAFLDIARWAQLEFLLTKPMVMVFLSISLVPTGMLILNELANDKQDSVDAALALGVDKTSIFWGILVQDNRRLVVLAFALSLCRVLTEAALIAKLSEGTAISLDPGDPQFTYGLADLLSQTISAQENLFLVTIILVLSIFGKILVSGGAALFGRS